MLKHLLLVAVLLTVSPALAQSSSPTAAGYTLKDQADYAKYAPLVVETVGWLEKSTLPTDSPQRRQANTFLMEWMTGSPTVSIQVSEYLGNLYDKDPDLLMTFLGGWARYAIQHPEVKDPLALNTAGLETMLTAYQTKGSQGNRKLNELLRLKAAGQLAEWVKTRLKS